MMMMMAVVVVMVVFLCQTAGVVGVSGVVDDLVLSVACCIIQGSPTV